MTGAERLSGLGEEGLLARIRAVAVRHHDRLVRGIGDDAAVLACTEHTLVTTDLLAEGVHFVRARNLPYLLGRKTMAVNLSDIAAMAGTPWFAFLSLAAPRDFPVGEMDEILRGILDRCAEDQVVLAGGDITEAQSLVMNVTVVGGAEPPAPVYRSGARPGDGLYVSGSLGGSALGLARLLAMDPPLTEQLLASDPLRPAILRHLDPPARLAGGRALAGRATAMMDLSDGLLTDLPRLLIESGGLGAEIEIERLPLDGPVADARRSNPDGDWLACAIAGGEDYELLFAGPDDRIPAAAGGLPLTRIGRITAGPGIVLRGPDGPVPAPAPRFAHFRESP